MAWCMINMETMYKCTLYIHNDNVGTNLTLLRPGKLVGSPLQHLTGPRPGALTAAEQPLEQLAGLDTENIINR